VLWLADNLSREKRSKVMASIRGKNTRPEVTIRKMLWQKGIRYRIHNKKVFGTPDISIKKKNVAVFIDGCFWHGCSRCYRAPTTNVEFWRNKIENNKKRRNKVKRHLKKDGWKVLEFWEHRVHSEPQQIAKTIASYLN